MYARDDVNWSLSSDCVRCGWALACVLYVLAYFVLFECHVIVFSWCWLRLFGAIHMITDVLRRWGIRFLVTYQASLDLGRLNRRYAYGRDHVYLSILGIQSPAKT
jgi:hypothetical protein